jgi:hypothetical protein
MTWSATPNRTDHQKMIQPWAISTSRHFFPTCQQPRLFTRFLNDVPNMGYLLVGGLALLGGMFIPPLLIFVAVIAVLWPAHTSPTRSARQARSGGARRAGRVRR